MQAIDNFFRDAYQIFDQKWLGDEILDAIHERPETLLDIRPARHKQEWDMPGRFARSQFLEELSAIQAGHLVVAQNHVGRCVDDLQERVRAIRGSFHRAERLKPLHDQFAHQRGIVRPEQSYGLVPCRPPPPPPSAPPPPLHPPPSPPALST